MQSIDPEWKPRQTKSNFISLVTSSFKPIVLICIKPMLLLWHCTPKYSSPGLTVSPKIFTPLVEAGCHLRMKSKACLPDVELFSSDLTHMAICPESEATKKPFENSFMHVIFVISLSSSPWLLNAFSMYYLVSGDSMKISPSAVVAAIFSSSSHMWSV